MPHFQCEKCSAIVAGDAMPEQCESCGAPASEAYPKGAAVEDVVSRPPVEPLFDLGQQPSQAEQRPTGEVARLRTSSSPEVVPRATTQELDELDMVESGEIVAEEEGPTLVEPSEEEGATVVDQAPGPPEEEGATVVEEKPAGPSAEGAEVWNELAQTTLELSEEDVVDARPVEEAEETEKTVSPGEPADKEPTEPTRAPQGEGRAKPAATAQWNELARTTLELDEGDLIEQPADEEGPTVKRRPPDAVVSDEEPTAKRRPPRREEPAETTQELDERDLVRPTPPPLPAARSAAAVKPRDLPGRVAYPIAPDQAMPPRRPAKEEPRPRETDKPPPAPEFPEQTLPSHTQSLGGLRARRRRRAARQALVVGIAALVGASVAVAIYTFARRREEPRPPLVVVDAAPSPDLAPVVDARPPADLRRPDQAVPDQAVPAARPPAPTPPPDRPPPTPAPPVTPRPTPAPKPVDAATILAEAQSLYREGLQLLLRGQLNEAVQKFNAALKRNPRLSLAYRGLGLAYEKQGSKALAKQAFKRYLRLRADAPDAETIRKRIEGL